MRPRRGVGWRWAVCVSVLFAWLAGASAQLPDLIVFGEAADPTVSIETFSANDCAVNEGCVQPGTRKLLRFNTETRNLGPGNLVLGNPVGNPLFVYDTCHGHHHFDGFADYRLVDTNSQLVVAGHKAGFCLLDLVQWDPSVSTNEVFDCGYQGIQKGWADVYDSGLDCQWIDITGVPDGSYTLELEVNPDHIIAEANYSNNVVAVPVIITTPPPCTNVTTISCGQTINGTLSSADCVSQGQGSGFHADQYRFNGLKGQRISISLNSTSFDAYLFLFDPFNTPIAVDDDGGPGMNSQIPTNGTFVLPADGQYIIEASSFDFGATGAYSVLLNCPSQPPFMVKSIRRGATGVATITWAASPSETYWVQYVTPPSVLWLNLASYTANAGHTTLTNTDLTATNALLRMYRIKLTQ